MDFAGSGRIIVHDRSLLTPLQGQGHGGSAVRIDLTHQNLTGGNLLQKLSDSVHIPELLHALPPGLPNQRMLRLPHHLFQHFRTSKPLHPQRMPAASLGPHHESPAAVIAEGHIKHRCRRKQCGQNGLGAFRADPAKKPLRQSPVAIGIEQEAVLLVHATHLHVQLPASRLRRKQRQRPIDSPSENGVDHELAVSGLIPKMFRNNCPVIRQAPRHRNLPPQILCGKL